MRENSKLIITCFSFTAWEPYFFLLHVPKYIFILPALFQALSFYTYINVIFNHLRYLEEHFHVGSLNEGGVEVFEWSNIPNFALNQQYTGALPFCGM